jgi:putative nucleotidyltransferase with HDIG domain
VSTGLDRGRAEGVVRALAALLKAQGLYPPGHTATVRAAREVEGALRRSMAGGAPLLMGTADGYLVVGDEAFLDSAPQAVEVFGLLEARGVEAAIIEPEVRGEEVERFCAWLRSPGGEPWVGRDVSLTRLRQGKGGWEGALRAHRVAVEALEKAYGELEEGRMPDLQAARSCVQEFSSILAENPALLKGLLLLKDYDRYTFHHSVNVSILALLLGQREGLDEADMDVIGVSGLLHDIGKTRTPAEVVRKPGRLTGEEWRVMLLHPKHGRDILEEMGGGPARVPLLVYEHHMHFDGGGYPPRPEGYRSDRRTPLVTLADVYDAMTTHRPYSAPLALPEAVAAMEGLRGRLLPPEAVDGFLRVMGRIPVGSVVRLVSGEVAVVCRIGSGGEVEAVRVVVTREGARLPPAEAPDRDVRPAEVVHWVNPLAHAIDPAEVLRERE